MSDFSFIAAGEIKFLNQVLNFNPVDYSEKNDFEIISRYSDILKSIRTFRFAAYFKLLDDFTFSLCHSSNDSIDDLISAINESLIDSHTIAKTLSTNTYSSFEYSEQDKILLFPLSGSTGLLGYLILSFSDVLASDIIVSNIKLLTNILSQLLDSYYKTVQFETIKKEQANEIKKITDEILESTRYLTKIIEAIPTGVILYDPDTEIIKSLNIKAAEMIGDDRDKIIGTSREEYFLISKATSLEISNKSSYEALLTAKDGSLIPVLTTHSAIESKTGNYIIESFTDITEKKQMENELLKAHFELEHKVEVRTSELSKINEQLLIQIQEKIAAQQEQKKLLMAIHQSPVPIFITNLKTEIEYVNPQFLKEIEYSAEELIGKKPNFFIDAEFSFSDFREFHSIIQSNRTWNSEIRNKTKSGETYWTSTSISPVFDEDKKIGYFVVVQENITKKKKEQEALIRAKTDAEKAESMKTNLLNNFSHEFRTPLISILGFSELLVTEIKETDLLDMANSIYSSGIRLMETLNNILEVTQLSSDNNQLMLETIPLGDMLQKIYENERYKVEEKNLEFILNIVNDTSEVSVDSDLLEKSILKLISNAIKFTNQGSITLLLNKKKIDGKDYVQLSVEDTGIGISEKNIDQIFEPFRQESEGPNRNFDGIGLGLWIARRIIELLNGAIEVKSEKKKGTIFTISLPVAEN